MTAGCPVPIVMAGGKKLPELEALEMAYRAVQEGAAGVDMGRNIFQIGASRGDDPGRREGRARGRAARGGLRAVPRAVARRGACLMRTRTRQLRRLAAISSLGSSRPGCGGSASSSGARQRRDRARPRRTRLRDDRSTATRAGRRRTLRAGRAARVGRRRNRARWRRSSWVLISATGSSRAVRGEADVANGKAQVARRLGHLLLARTRAWCDRGGARILPQRA